MPVKRMSCVTVRTTWKLPRSITRSAMPDVYVDRWRMGKRGQFEKVWVAVPVPDDCPHPRDRTKWGAHYKKPKTQWVITEGARV